MMQSLDGRQYVAVVADGKMKTYPQFGARMVLPTVSGAPMTKRSKTKKPGSVRKIVPSIIPSEPEKAEIEVHGADQLYRELRIENILEDEKGNKVKLKKDAAVEVIIEADLKDTTPKD